MIEVLCNVLGEKVSWRVTSSAVEDVVRLGFSTGGFRSFSERDAYEIIRSALAREGVTWVQPSLGGWQLDLKGLANVVAQYRSLPWLNGIIRMKPEFGSEILSAGPPKVGNGEFVFYITPETASEEKRTAASGERTKVFLVHGRDTRALHEVARFLEKLDQDVIVLRELPNKGRTIIEKFENFANVSFAVVLLTPDDLGGTAPAIGPEEFQPRARQNVIFELGYFIGRLGRNKVCALYAEGVEVPSDYDGVIYTKLDEAGAWRLDLAKELRAAGIAIDMNLAL